MNVLSLFDGVSCGRLALNRAGIKYDKYYASEINQKAIRVTQHHFPDTIQLGSILNVIGEDLNTIDLIIGGSPCTNLSQAGNKTGLLGKESKLFFEYVRLLEECKPKYFLLENVPMRKVYQDIITAKLGVEPIIINSDLVSKQSRKRLYWTNIPFTGMPQDKGLMFNEWLLRIGHGYISWDILFYKKHPTLTSQHPATKYKLIPDINKVGGRLFQDVKKDESICTTISPEFCEELQTLPIGYTSMINKTARYECIGNGWTVDVIAHIFRGLK